jgi:hypothetical protein
MGGTCSTHGKVRKLYKMLVAKRQGKRPVTRHRGRWKDNIKINLNNGRPTLEYGLDSSVATLR